MIKKYQYDSRFSLGKHSIKLNTRAKTVGFIPSYFFLTRKRCLQNLIITFAMLCGLLLTQMSCNAEPPQAKLCPTGQAVQSKDGIRRLALIIGVGQYKSPEIPDLLGPPNDVQHFYDLLTNSKGYGFPKENVCILLNENATTANFKKFFAEALVNRAQEKDEAVVFYAGHGSQAEDTNKDEPDGMDETLVFHDARTDEINDLLDDEFDQLLQQLYAKTHHISVFLDSCNSGTALRGGEDFVARYVAPVKAKKAKRLASPVSRSIDNNATGWVSSSLPDAVFFTAASDGTSALEKGGRGIFTDALITTLGQIGSNKLTYAQAARQIRPLVKAESFQIPYFQGDLERGVFSDSSRIQPLGWEVKEVTPKLTLGGYPLPGIGKNAEFRIYSGNLTGADTQDPAKAKAMVLIDESNGINANAHVISRVKNAETIKPGDLAILARPGDQQTLLKVTIRPKSENGGISSDKTDKLKANLKSHNDANKVISIVPNGGDFEVSVDKQGKYVVKGPENIIRSTLTKEEDVIFNLWLHAKQKVLSALRGEGGSEFIDQETLQVQLIPAQKQDSCAKAANWQQQAPNSINPQEIPLCYKFNIKVKLSEKILKPMLVGGLVLSTDGTIFGFPADGTAAPIQPGKEYVFAAKSETFKAAPPLNIQDQIIVFGTHEANPVSWTMLSAEAKTRGLDMANRGIKSGLYQALDRYISGTRGVDKEEETEVKNDATWTLSSITMRVYDPKHP